MNIGVRYKVNTRLRVFRRVGSSQSGLGRTIAQREGSTSPASAIRNLGLLLRRYFGSIDDLGLRLADARVDLV
jgi:hypothetical protein